MLARCDTCQKPFVTPRPGAQPCPHCGAGVEVDAPPGMAQSPAPRGEAGTPANLPVAGTLDAWAGAPQGKPQPAVGLAETGFWSLLWAMLSAPRGLRTVSSEWTVKRSVRFGYLCALCGLLGTALKDALADTAVPEAVLKGASDQGRCVMEQAAAFEAHLQPWTLARLPLSPLLAVLLTYGVLHFVHLMVTAMGRSSVDFSDAARALAPCLAPLFLAALPMMAFGLCLAWSMVLMAQAVERVYKLPWGLSGAVTSLPVLGYAAWEVLLQLHVARPCLNLG